MNTHLQQNIQCETDSKNDIKSSPGLKQTGILCSLKDPVLKDCVKETENWEKNERDEMVFL